jgi:hypothetical protein
MAVWYINYTVRREYWARHLSKEIQLLVALTHTSNSHSMTFCENREAEFT